MTPQPPPPPQNAFQFIVQFLQAIVDISGALVGLAFGSVLAWFLWQIAFG